MFIEEDTFSDAFARWIAYVVAVIAFILTGRVLTCLTESGSAAVEAMAMRMTNE